MSGWRHGIFIPRAFRFGEEFSERADTRWEKVCSCSVFGVRFCGGWMEESSTEVEATLIGNGGAEIEQRSGFVCLLSEVRRRFASLGFRDTPPLGEVHHGAVFQGRPRGTRPSLRCEIEDRWSTGASARPRMTRREGCASWNAVEVRTGSSLTVREAGVRCRAGCPLHRDTGRLPVLPGGCDAACWVWKVEEDYWVTCCAGVG